MAAETYEQWKKRNGWDTKIFPDDVQRRVYGWAQKHPGAPDGSVLDELVKTAARLHPAGDYSIGEQIKQSLSTRKGFAGTSTYGQAKIPGDGAPTPAPSGQTATSPAKPDAASAVKTGNSTIDAAIQQALAGGTTTGSVSLWPSLGVDPNATVLGKVPITASTNTMNASGQLQHGTGNSLGVGGDQVVTKTADEWLKGLYKMSPTQLADLQRQLWSQGWYNGTKVTDPSQIQFGRPDAATLAAYAAVLGETARYNAADQRIGIDGVIGMGSPTKGQSTANGQPYVTTNPADLAAAFRTQAQQDLGRDPTADELQAYQHQYLGQEDAARRAIIAAGNANQTVGIEGPPSPSAGAEDYINTHDLADKVAYGAAVRQQAFFSMLKSPV